MGHGLSAVLQRRAVRTPLYHSRYAPRFGLSLRDTASWPPAIAMRYAGAELAKNTRKPA